MEEMKYEVKVKQFYISQVLEPCLPTLALLDPVTADDWEELELAR